MLLSCERSFWTRSSAKSNIISGTVNVFHCIFTKDNVKVRNTKISLMEKVIIIGKTHFYTHSKTDIKTINCWRIGSKVWKKTGYMQDTDVVFDKTHSHFQEVTSDDLVWQNYSDMNLPQDKQLTLLKVKRICQKDKSDAPFFCGGRIFYF